MHQKNEVELVELEVVVMMREEVGQNFEEEEWVKKEECQVISFDEDLNDQTVQRPW